MKKWDLASRWPCSLSWSRTAFAFGLACTISIYFNVQISLSIESICSVQVVQSYHHSHELLTLLWQQLCLQPLCSPQAPCHIATHRDTSRHIATHRDTSRHIATHCTLRYLYLALLGPFPACSDCKFEYCSTTIMQQPGFQTSSSSSSTTASSSSSSFLCFYQKLNSESLMTCS